MLPNESFWSQNQHLALQKLLSSFSKYKQTDLYPHPILIFPTQHLTFPSGISTSISPQVHKQNSTSWKFYLSRHQIRFCVIYWITGLILWKIIYICVWISNTISYVVGLSRHSCECCSKLRKKLGMFWIIPAYLPRNPPEEHLFHSQTTYPVPCTHIKKLSLLSFLSLVPLICLTGMTGVWVCNESRGKQIHQVHLCSAGLACKWKTAGCKLDNPFLLHTCITTQEGNKKNAKLPTHCCCSALHQDIFVIRA